MFNYISIAQLGAFLISFGVCFLAKGRFFLDTPNDRSSHTRPTSRFGGVGIYVGLISGLCIAHIADPSRGFEYLKFIALAGFLWILGAIDDYKHVNVYFRLLGQLAFAFLVMGVSQVYLPLPEGLSSISYPLTVLFIVGFINASNFSDGINGLWSGTVMIGILWFVVLCGGVGLNDPLAISVAAILGFFILNYPRGLIFLGDSGSTFLGGLILLYGMHIAKNNALNFSGMDIRFYKNILIVFSPFAFIFSDIAVTLLKRLFQGHHPFIAHKNHFKQKLVHELELSHGLVTFIYLCGALLGVSIIGVSGLIDPDFSLRYLLCLAAFILIKLMFMAIVQVLCMRQRRRIVSS